MTPNKRSSSTINYADIDPTLRKQLKFLGFADALAPRILKHFGSADTAINVLMSNPYHLMEIEGIGFTKADAAAKLLGITDNDERRQRALVLKFMNDASNSAGHVYIPFYELSKNLRKENIADPRGAMELLENEKQLVVERDGPVPMVFLTGLWTMETQLAEDVKTRLATTPPYDIPPNTLGDVVNTLDPSQQEAVSSFTKHNLLIITGGPGCGKTHTVNFICRLLDAVGLKIVLCAPTGKAAKRLQELSGREASTIHRLLGAGWGGSWEYNRRNQLRGYDWIICDESSMNDIRLSWRLLQALPLSTNLIFVGDVDQLPPVGPGSFFRDLIKSNLVKVVRFNINHRQGKGSQIAETAMKINRGDLTLSFNDDDLQFSEVDNPIDIRSKIEDIIANIKSEGYDLIRETQVLTPQKETNVGVKALNDLLRFMLNPRAKARERFSPGDKVMQTINNYDLEVFNGFIGVVTEVDAGAVVVDYPDIGEIEYTRRLAENELTQAWAITVHKAQGSEFKAGIVVCSSLHHYMLSRNLLYTAITRFRQKCVVLGDRGGLARAVKNNKEADRYSRFMQRLKGEVRNA